MYIKGKTQKMYKKFILIIKIHIDYCVQCEGCKRAWKREFKGCKIFHSDNSSDIICDWIRAIFDVPVSEGKTCLYFHYRPRGG